VEQIAWLALGKQADCGAPPQGRGDLAPPFARPLESTSIPCSNPLRQVTEWTEGGAPDEFS